jgi:hypothetical protein
MKSKAKQSSRGILLQSPTLNPLNHSQNLQSAFLDAFQLKTTKFLYHKIETTRIVCMAIISISKKAVFAALQVSTKAAQSL